MPYLRFLFNLIFVLVLSTYFCNAQNTGNCTTPTTIPELVFEDNQTTCGLEKLNIQTNCLSPEYFGGEAYVYSYTATKTTNISIEVMLNSRPIKGGLAILDACPDQGGAQCLGKKDYDQPLPDGDNYYLGLTEIPVVENQTYYIVIAGGTCTESGQGTFSVGCEDNISDARRQCPCGEMDYAKNYNCNQTINIFNPAYLRAEYWCVCPPTCTLGEAFCSDFQISIERNPIGEVANANDCSDDNLGFENGNLANWQAATYQGGSDYCTPDYFPNNECDQPVCYSCLFAACKDPNNFDMCPLTPDPHNLGNTPTDFQMTECRNLQGAKNDARFSLMTGGFDPNTDGKLPMVSPNGGGNSMRLGNQGSGYQAECMWNEFVVTDRNKLLVYQYAMVLQDPNHPMNQHNTYDSPRFVGSLTDLAGNPVGCGNQFSKVSLQARDLADGFQRAQNPQCNVTEATAPNGEQNWSTIYYKPWTTVGVDLSAYIGQTLRLKFCTSDCGRGGHYAYSYVDVYCIGPELGQSVCIKEGENVSFAAPPGFTDYRWYEGTDTTGTIIGRGEEIDLQPTQDFVIYTVSFAPLAGTNSCPRSMVHDTVRVFKAYEAGDDTSYCISNIQPGDSIQLFLKNMPDPSGLTINWRSVPGNFTSNEQNPILTGNDIPKVNTQFIVEVTSELSQRCSFTDTVNIVVLPPPTLTVEKEDTRCSHCEGSVTAFPQGMGPFIYEWNNGSSVESISGLCAGDYAITITDINGCKDSTNTSISDSPGPAVTATGTPINCFGECIGTATVIVTQESVQPYSFIWDDPAAQTTQTATGLCIGTYSVTMTDSNGCVDSATTTITGPPDLTAQVVPQDLLCFEENTGSVTLTASGGTLPYSYTWSNSATTQNITGLPAGDYSVTVTDANGCFEILTTSLTQPPQVSVTVNTDEVCEGNCDAELTATPQGGTPPYSFIWNDPANSTTESIQNLCIGEYIVTITDANGCTAVDTGVVTNFPPPVVQVSKTDTRCNHCEGTGTAIPPSAGGPYSFEWNTGNNTANITGLCAGDYFVTMTDESTGCKDTSSISIATSNGPLISTTNGEIGCFGDCTGSVAAIITRESAPPYTFIWDDPNVQTTQTATGLCIGTYNVTITDSNGCTDIATATVTGPPDITATIAHIDLLCFEENTGSASVTVSGGTLPYNYIWSNGATTENITGLPVGDYSVTATDLNGCFEILSTSLSQPPQVHVSVNIDEVCKGNCDAGLSAIPAGGTPPYTFAWNDPKNSRTAAISDLCEGEYIVTVTDANGCTATDTGIVTSFPPPEGNIWSFRDCPGALLQLPSSDGGVTYRWSPATRLSNPNAPHPITTIEEPIKYTVTITNEFGCKWQDEVNISVEYDPSFTLHIPNSFTPNEDGNDDLFQYTGDFSGIVWFECQIWNRWGEKIYHTYELTDYWNGRYNNVGEYVKDGAYVYIIRAKDDCVIKHKRDGTHIGWVIVLKGDS